jgi:hemoglobin
MPASIYERLGGQEAIFATVESFYSKIMGDPLVAPFFDGLTMDAQIKKQVAFLTMAFGGPSGYTGRDLRSAHAGLVSQGLSDEHFDRVAQHLQQTLQELDVPTPLIEEVLAIVASTRKDVLCR